MLDFCIVDKLQWCDDSLIKLHEVGCIVSLYVTVCSMIVCIQVLFQPVFPHFKKKINYHGAIGPRYKCSFVKIVNIVDVFYCRQSV